MKVATDRTKTHFKGALDYLMTVVPSHKHVILSGGKDHKRKAGYTTTVMYDEDLCLATILDSYDVKAKYN